MSAIVANPVFHNRDWRLITICQATPSLKRLKRTALRSFSRIYPVHPDYKESIERWRTAAGLLQSAWVVYKEICGRSRFSNQLKTLASRSVH